MFVFDHSHKQLSLNALGHRLRSVPMLIISLSFALGIVVADGYSVPLWAIFSGVILSGVLAWVVRSAWRWAYCFLAIALLGYAASVVRAPYASVPYDDEYKMVAIVRGIPAPRDGYRVAEGKLEAFEADDGWHRADDRVQLWLRSDSVEVGDRLLVYGKLVRRMSRFEGYDELLCRRGYVGGVSVTEHNLLSLDKHRTTTLQQRAVSKLGRYCGDSLSHATVEAMVAGSRSGISPKLREAYSRTGLSHILAVSGLHLAVVAMAVGWLLTPLALLHRGHRLRDMLVIIALWLFAFASGASPSVLRAALMFSVVQLAYFSSSRYASLNALMATIFLMLVYRPDYLYDLSFQLSVAAVVGIVVWAVPFVRGLRCKGYLVRVVSTSFAVGIAATLWTMPIVSHHFANLPLIGVVVTPLLLPLAYLVVGSGVVALALPSVVSTPFITLAEWAAWVQNWVVDFASKPWWAGIEYRLDEGAVAVIYALYAIITLVMWSTERKKVITL